MIDQAQLAAEAKAAMSHFWSTRKAQATKQTGGGDADRGARAAVTGGAQMDGFVELFANLIARAGMPREAIFRKKAIELPGFFRPTKEWDLLVVLQHQLILALEAKSQIGPSFGNNFNNRTEEALGSALDLWTAFRKGAFNKSQQPWLGYLFLLENCPQSQSPVKVSEPHFKVLKEFENASYAKRYELFCRKLVRERHYNAACFLTSQASREVSGDYSEPVMDLNLEGFVRSLTAHVSAYAPNSSPWK